MSKFARIRPSGRMVLAIALLLIGLPVRALALETVVVNLDQAKMIRLPERTATIVIGNPLIADASLQAGGMVVLTGKGYGTTSFVALDRSGTVLIERNLLVEGPPLQEVVIVYRGVERETWSCTPKCEPRITPGDTPVFFNTVINQTVTRSGLASPAYKEEKK
jgi:putative type II/III system pilus formation protein